MGADGAICVGATSGEVTSRFWGPRALSGRLNDSSGGGGVALAAPRKRGPVKGSVSCAALPGALLGPVQTAAESGIGVSSSSCWVALDRSRQRETRPASYVSLM